MAVCENLRLLRVIKNYAQKFVAGELKLCQPTYNRYETDSREVPDDCLQNASQLYNVPVEAIKSELPIVDISLILTAEERELIKQLRFLNSKELNSNERKKETVKLVEGWLGK